MNKKHLTLLYCVRGRRQDRRKDRQRVTMCRSSIDLESIVIDDQVFLLYVIEKTYNWPIKSVAVLPNMIAVLLALFTVATAAKSSCKLFIEYVFIWFSCFFRSL